VQDVLTISVPKTPKKFKNKDISFDKFISRKTTQSELHQPEKKNGLKNLDLFSNSMTKKCTFPKLVKVKYKLQKGHEIY